MVAQVGVPGPHPAPRAGCQSAQVQLHRHRSCPGAGDGHVNGRTLAFPAKVAASLGASRHGEYHSTRSLLTLPLLLVSRRSFPASTLGTSSVSGAPPPQRCPPAGELGLLEFVPPCLQTLPDALPAPITRSALPLGLCWQQRERRHQGEAQGRNPQPSLWFPYLTAALSSRDAQGEGAEGGAVASPGRVPAVPSETYP